MTDQELALRAALITDIPTVQWMGDPIDSMPSARALLSADQQVFTDEQEREALAFFDGSQWPEDIASTRVQSGRPCLTVNRVPLLLAAAINAGDDAGEGPLEFDELTRLKIILTRRNMDAQRVYNFMCSNAGEIAQSNADIARATISIPTK